MIQGHAAEVGTVTSRFFVSVPRDFGAAEAEGPDPQEITATGCTHHTLLCGHYSRNECFQEFAGTSRYFIASWVSQVESGRTLFIGRRATW